MYCQWLILMHYFWLDFPPCACSRVPDEPGVSLASLGQHPSPPAPTADSLLLGVLSWFEGAKGRASSVHGHASGLGIEK